MSTTSLTGNDTITVNDRVLADLADGDAVTLEYPNEIASVKTGKNGNSIYALNESGKHIVVKIRVIRGSADDKFLNGLLAQQQANFAGFVLMIGEFIKKVGDGLGNITSDTYICSGGVFTNPVNAKTSVEGDTEQSVAVHTIKYTNAPRVLT
jgi:hypothetical protein